MPFGLSLAFVIPSFAFNVNVSLSIFSYSSVWGARGAVL